MSGSNYHVFTYRASLLDSEYPASEPLHIIEEEIFCQRYENANVMAWQRAAKELIGKFDKDKDKENTYTIRMEFVRVGGMNR